MDMDGIISSILDYIQANAAVSVVAAVVILYLLVKRPRILLVLIIIAAVVYGVTRIFTKLSATGLG